MASTEEIRTTSDNNNTNKEEEEEEEKEQVYKTKLIQFLGRSTPIILQNDNGPCPLLAICKFKCNVLLLRNNLNLNNDMNEVSLQKLLSLVAERLIDSNSNTENKDAGYLGNQQQNIGDAIDLLPRLATGIDVNVQFRKIDDFEFTRECAIFDLLDMPLYHGWIVDPQVERTFGCPYCRLPYEKQDSWMSSKDPPSPKECICSEEEKENCRQKEMRSELWRKEREVEAVEKRKVDGELKIDVQIFYVSTSFTSNESDTRILKFARAEVMDELEDFQSFLALEMNKGIPPPPFIKQKLYISYENPEGKKFDLDDDTWADFKRRGINAVARLACDRDYRKPYASKSLGLNIMMLWGDARAKQALLCGFEEVNNAIATHSIGLLYFSYNCPLQKVHELISVAEWAEENDVPFVFHSNEKMTESFCGVVADMVSEQKLKTALKDHEALRSDQGDIWGKYIKAAAAP